MGNQGADQVKAQLQSREAVILTAAMMAHEANKAWCEMNEDFSQMPWHSAPEWQQVSAMNGMRFHFNNPGADNSASHNSWFGEKLADGWKYGPKKDPERKEHPCMVPYDELPLEQRLKDGIFRGIAEAFREAWHQAE